MPIYEYACSTCGHRSEEFESMSSRPLTQCPACVQEAYHRVPSLPHNNLIEFHKPIEMHSIAMEDPDEIKSFLRQAPDVECSLNPEDPMFGIPIARNRSQKTKALSAAGFTERN